MEEPYLVADVGGTNARFALVDKQGKLSAVKRLSTADYATLEEAIRAYLQPLNVTVHHAAIAIANPILGDEIRMTNHHWSFSIHAMQCSLALTTLHFINDFTAQALSVLQLLPKDKHKICGGEATNNAAIAVLGPGTGLGVSGLLPDGRGGWCALSGEGGHVSFTPCTEAEYQLWQFAQARFCGHVSAERLICGSGLSLIDEALAQQNGRRRVRSAAAISAAALSGEAQAKAAMDHFSAMLATVASNLALTLGARGGVYLCGGILPRVVTLLEQGPFAQRFIDKGRFADYLAAIPVWLVTDDQLAGLTGAAIALSRRLAR